ncbi:MAG: CHAT domain-containing protein, partial [Methylococcales bacterium]|nr:CHAT domain-containing protein [Methylococcales bacterium]
LGRVYGGEGVVGLNSAFLAAGAQAVSSSLWTVSDTATNLFMSQLYTLVERDKMSYAAAMAEVKRGFIRGEHGDEMKHPFYWSAFVYYGVSH